MRGAAVATEEAFTVRWAGVAVEKPSTAMRAGVATEEPFTVRWAGVAIKEPSTEMGVGVTTGTFHSKEGWSSHRGGLHCKWG